MRLFGCKLVVEDVKLAAVLEDLLKPVEPTQFDLDKVVPGLRQASIRAIRDLAERRLKADTLLVKEGTVRALPPIEFDRDDSCVPGPCGCGMTHDPDYRSPRSAHYTF